MSWENTLTFFSGIIFVIKQIEDFVKYLLDLLTKDHSLTKRIDECVKYIDLFILCLSGINSLIMQIDEFVKYIELFLRDHSLMIKTN